MFIKQYKVGIGRSLKIMKSQSQPPSDVSSMYDAGYQSGCDGHKYISQFEILAETFTKMFQPTKAIDFGCGKAPMTKKLIELGIAAVGIEGSIHARSNYILNVDLRTVQNYWENDYDLLTCFDVAEHLEEQYADHLVKVIVDSCAGSKRDVTLLFGAATVGQDGHGHVNCQDPPYWREKFESHGFTHDEPKTKELVALIRDATNHVWWVAKNLNVFMKIKGT